jgi:hypothetical protein
VRDRLVASRHIRVTVKIGKDKSPAQPVFLSVEVGGIELPDYHFIHTLVRPRKGVLTWDEAVTIMTRC